jgi:ubiquitin carboxyl-terminal hydrolase 9/24
MKVALDEGPGPPIKFQYPDLSKLHQVVSHLVRSSDISSKCQNSMSAMAVLPNDYIEPNIPAESLMPLSAEAMEYLFNKTR